MHYLSTILKPVSVSAGDAELGTLFTSRPPISKNDVANIPRNRNPQPSTFIHVDNSTCAEIVNDTQKHAACKINNVGYWAVICKQSSLSIAIQDKITDMRDFGPKRTGAIHHHV